MPTDKKISELTADPSISDDDLIPVVNDPAGTPTTNMITVSNLFASSSFSAGVLALNPVLKSATSTAGFSFVDTDGTMAGNSSTKVPSQSAVVTYVTAHGGQSGDVHSTDTQTKTTGVTWSWVNDTGTLAASTTTVPTEQTAKAYVDALPTLTTSDTSKVPVTTTGGVTILDVTNLSSTSVATFSDAAFTLQNASASTQQAQFDCSNITAGVTRVFKFPNNAGTATLLTDLSTATVYNKTTRAPVLQSSDVTGYGITMGHHLDVTFSNDLSRSQLFELFGNASAQPTIGFINQSGTAAVPATTANGAALGNFTFRGTAAANTISSGNHAKISVLADEAIATGRGCHIGFFTTQIATTNAPLEGLRITSDAVPGTVLRGVLAVGAGSSMASAAAGYGVEVKSGAIGYGVGVGGTITQTTSKTTAVTLNAVCGAITTFATSMGNGTSSTFTLTNSTIAATDIVLVTASSVGTAGGYSCWSDTIAAGSCKITLRNLSGGTLAEAVVLTFIVVKAATS